MRPRDVWSAGEAKLVRTMLAAGASRLEIGTRLGRSRCAVAGLDLSRRARDADRTEAGEEAVAAETGDHRDEEEFATGRGNGVANQSAGAAARVIQRSTSLAGRRRSFRLGVLWGAARRRVELLRLAPSAWGRRLSKALNPRVLKLS